MMKKLILTCAAAGCILFSTTLMAQNVKSSLVPAAASSALMKKYPAASKITWEKEKGNFEGNWGGKDGEAMSVTFTPTGQFVEQVEAMQPSALPAGVAAYVKAHHKGAKVAEAGKATDAKGVVTYEAEVKGKILIFDDKGAFLKVE